MAYASPIYLLEFSNVCQLRVDRFMRVAVSILALGIMLSVAGVPGAEAAQPINVRLSWGGIPLDPTSGKVSCEATAAGNDDAFHGIYLRLYDPEGRLLNEDYAEGYGDVRAYVESDPTTTGEYRCTADFYTDREYVWTANGYPREGYREQLRQAIVTIQESRP